MLIDYLLGAIVTVVIMVYLVYRADPTRAILGACHDRQWLGSDRAYTAPSSSPSRGRSAAT